MTVRLVTEEHVQPERADVPDQPKPQRPGREERDAAILVQASAMMTTLARIVSVRVILLLSVVGAFALALYVIRSPSIPALVVMGLYTVMVGGIVALESGILRRE